MKHFLLILSILLVIGCTQEPVQTNTTEPPKLPNYNNSSEPIDSEKDETPPPNKEAIIEYTINEIQSFSPHKYDTGILFKNTGNEKGIGCACVEFTREEREEKEGRTQLKAVESLTTLVCAEVEPGERAVKMISKEDIEEICNQKMDGKFSLEEPNGRASGPIRCDEEEIIAQMPESDPQWKTTSEEEWRFSEFIMFPTWTKNSETGKFELKED
ncbi:hypothetical protein K8R43_03465 [archaeon]|nr:hypothetical protein [archaeon]